jgi:predicted RecA/RadA family phage recombinase
MKNRVRESGSWEYINAGEDTIASGAVVDLATQIGIANADILAGETGVLDTQGIFELPKDDNLAIDQGDLVYWDATNSWVDKTSTAQTYVGIAVKDSAQTETTVQVDINAPTRDIV